MCPGLVVIGGSEDEEIQGGGESFTTDVSLREAVPHPPFLRLKVLRTTAHRKSKRALKPLTAVDGPIRLR
jgi:hypothetical protein